MTSGKKVIKISTLAVFKNRKVIQVRDEDNPTVFYMLGGTIEPGETDVECLIREVKEEANTDIKEGTLKFLSEFEDKAHGRENTIVNMRMYSGELVGEPKPSNEIVEIKYFDSSIPKINQAPITEKIFKWLREHNYID